MIVHEFSDEEDNLPCNQFKEDHRNHFSEARHELNRDKLISRLLRSVHQDKDVLKRGQNREDNVMIGCGESDPELEAQQDDMPRGLDAEEQIHRGFKRKQPLEKGNQRCFLRDPFYNPQYDVEEEEDILRRLELDSEFKTEPEQNDNEEDEDILRRLELDNEMGDDNRKEEEEILIQLHESFIESALRQFKEQSEPHIRSTSLQRLPDRESNIEIKLQRMDEAIEKDASQPDNIKEDKHPLIQFMKSVPEAMNTADYNEQKNLPVGLNYGLKQKTMLKTLLDLEEIGLEFYIFIEDIIPMLNLNDDGDDKEKVRSKLEDKLKYVEKVKDLLLTSSKTVNEVINELERMKKKDEEKTENIPEILAQLMEFNAYLVERSFHHGIGFVFDKNYTKTELCVKELNRSREKLEIILRGLERMIKREIDEYER